MNRYYTETIPVTLAEKLKEKGIHPLRDTRMEGWLNSGDNITYAEVFDWLMEKGIILYLNATYKHFFWRIETVEGIVQIEEFESWREAAENAIEKALTLI